MTKRLFDILLTCFGLVFLLPLALFIALLIKLEDGGSVFFSQMRWGQNGKPFRAFKFRTMFQRQGGNGELHHGTGRNERVTKVGRILRATAMDELPQLINILKGDMSFVGPRALAVEELAPDFPGFAQRQSIRPGLTGMAQIYAPKDAPLETKFQYDMRYIRNHHFLLDLKMLLLSLYITARAKWECPDNKI